MDKTKKNTWYDCLINYISEPARESVGGSKDKIVGLFYEKHTQTNCVWERGRGKKLSKLREQNIKKLFTSEKNKNKEQKTKKDRIIRDILTLFEKVQEKE